MKTKLLIIAVVTIIVSACTTGTQLTRTYDDDIYFSPADAPPASMAQKEALTREDQTKAGNPKAGSKKIVMSQVQKNADGSSTLNNYILQPDDTTQSSGYQSYNLGNQNLMGADTSLYYNDDSIKYVINNYYDENDNGLDFTYRINRFHRPYYYDPFFFDDWYYGFNSPYYYGYYGYGPGLGFGSWYGDYWGYPYSYGYYSPFSIGFGGYWGNGYYGYGGYYGDYYGGYYGGGYYGGGFYNDHHNYDNVRYGRSTDLSNYRVGTNAGGVGRQALPGNTSNSRLPVGIDTGRSLRNSNVVSRSVDPSVNNVNNKSATLINDRRGDLSGNRVTNNNSRSQISSPNTSGAIRRSYEPSTTGRTYDQSRVVRPSQSYTPSYNKPRIVTQSNYNNNSYTRPRTSVTNEYNRSSVKSANTGSQNYSAPRSSSSIRQTYRSSTTYSNGSSSSSYRNSGSTYSYPSSSGSTYSAPERSSSYSSGSSSSGGGGSYSGGSSGGSSSGGSGGRSGSGGRR